VIRASRALAGALLVAVAGCAHSVVEGDRLRDDVVARLQHATEEARGLPLVRAVPARVVTAAEAPAIVRRGLLADASPEDLAAAQEALVTLGLWHEGRDLLESYVAMTGEAGAGFYLPHERTLYLVADAPVPTDAGPLAALSSRDFAREMVLAHELVHALQHQHHPFWFDHGAFLRAHADAATALQAALEGDATLYGFLAVDVPPPEPERFRDRLEQGLAQRAAHASGLGPSAFASAPPLLRASLFFPYANGYALAWREGRELLMAPPISTEQVLHADRRHEAFEAIDLAAGRAALPGGCRVVDENSAGELAISLLLAELAPGTEPPAWSGWDGDRYLAARCDGRRELVWITHWDEERDAVEFERAYARAAPGVAARAGFADAPAIVRRGREVVIASPGVASHAAAVAAAAQRARVATLEELVAHFGGTDAPARTHARPDPRSGAHTHPRTSMTPSAATPASQSR